MKGGRREIPAPHRFALETLLVANVLRYSSDVSELVLTLHTAECGNALSAVFDVRMRTGNPSEHEHSTNGRIEAPRSLRKVRYRVQKVRRTSSTTDIQPMGCSMI